MSRPWVQSPVCRRKEQRWGREAVTEEEGVDGQVIGQKFREKDGLLCAVLKTQDRVE